MPALTVVAHSPDHDAEWDALVRASPTGTFLHTRLFLGYHGTRFADASLAFRDSSGAMVAVLPAAAHPADPSLVISHPGATHGGLVGAPPLAGEDAHAALAAAFAHWHASGFRRLVYKAVPAIYHRSPYADDLYALARLGASRDHAVLASVIDLAVARPLSSRRRRSLRRARAAGVRTAGGAELLPALWPVVEDVLRERHDASPTHTLAEIQELCRRFPDEITVLAGMIGDEVVAGAVLFVTERLTHAQYLASGPRGREVGALDQVIADAVDAARTRGARWFDLGGSTEPEGLVLNAGLHTYKQEFGAGSVLYEHLAVPLLTAPRPPGVPPG